MCDVAGCRSWWVLATLSAVNLLRRPSHAGRLPKPECLPTLGPWPASTLPKCVVHVQVQEAAPMQAGRQASGGPGGGGVERG